MLNLDIFLGRITAAQGWYYEFPGEVGRTSRQTENQTL